MRIFAKTLALAAFAALAFIGPVRAEEAAPAKTAINIAVVDIQALLKDSKAAKSIEGQLATIRKNFQAEVDTEEKSLRAKEKAIMDQKASLKEEEFKAKASDFQKDVATSQKKIQDKKAKLDKAVATAIGTLRSEIVKDVAEIGNKQNLDMVLARTDVVIVSKNLDITQQVLTRLDADLPSVNVKVE
jgi:Skp family chaperone for outer membrane proteins